MEAKAKKRSGQPMKGRVTKVAKKGKNDGVVKIKRPLSAYLYFTKDFRAERAAKGLDNSKVNEVAKCAGERWRNMKVDEKKPYEAQARADKERYQQQTGKDVVKKDSEKPKRAPTAYFIFLADFRKEMAKAEITEKGGQKIPSLAGEKWRSMGDKDKEPFIKKEAEEKKKYEAAMEEYRKKVKDVPKPEKKSKPKKIEEPEEEEDDEDDDDDDDDEEDDDDDAEDDDDDDE